MTTDPIRFCYHGHHMKPRNTFRPLPGVKPKREVCEECYAKIMKARKERAKI